MNAIQYGSKEKEIIGYEETVSYNKRMAALDEKREREFLARIKSRGDVVPPSFAEEED